MQGGLTAGSAEFYSLERAVKSTDDCVKAAPDLTDSRLTAVKSTDETYTREHSNKALYNAGYETRIIYSQLFTSYPRDRCRAAQLVQ